MTTIISGGRPRLVRASYPGDRGAEVWRSAASSNYIRLLSQSGEFRAVTFEALYRRQPWVFATVNKLLFGIARLGLNVYDGDDSDTRKRVRGADGHGLPALLKTPFPGASEMRMKLEFLRDLFCQGEAVMLKARPSLSSVPNELWPIPLRWVQVREDNAGIYAYTVSGGGEPKTLLPEDVVHISLPGRVSPLEPLARTLALEDASMDWQSASLKNGVTPRAVFRAKSGKLAGDEDAQAKVRGELQKLYSGQDNAGKFALLGGEWDVDTLGVTATDVAILESRRLSREEVFGAYGLTLQQMGLSDKAAYASLLESRRAFYVDAIGGFMTLIEMELQAQLVQSEPAWDGLYVEFNADAVLRPDPEARARMHMLMMQSATNSTNQRRRYENDPPIGDPDDPENPYNVPWMPANMKVPGETVEPPPPVDPAADAANITAALITEALRAQPAPVVDVTMPDSGPRSRRIERDENGEIARIVEE